MNSYQTVLSLLVSLCYLLSSNTVAESNTNPYLQANNTWISISGTVKTVRPDSFTLDYGDSYVMVEMDDNDRDADGYKLLSGDKVVVNGAIDDDFYESTSIEASSVYVEKLNTYFYASAIDEEDYIDYSVWHQVPVQLGALSVQGFVTDIDSDSFTLNTGSRSISIDVDELAYDPLDDKGYVKIELGDIVRVYGKMEEQLIGDRELEADALTVLYHS